MFRERLPTSSEVLSNTTVNTIVNQLKHNNYIIHEVH